jgi:hypothetical protein
MNEELALYYNPCSDDDSDYRVLDNRMVTTRKPAECAICFEDIPTGARVRAQREVYDGHAKTFRFCPKCCTAMAHSAKFGHDSRAIERRTALGMKNAERRRRGTDA